MGFDEKEFIEVSTRALSNKDVIKKLQDAVCEPLYQEVNNLRVLIKSKDEKIEKLEKRVSDLELQVDDLEQYSRLNSLCINGIKETENENLTEKVLDLINNTLELSPSATVDQIDRMHRTAKTNYKSTVLIEKIQVHLRQAESRKNIPIIH